MTATKPNLLIFVSDHFRAEALHHLGNAASYTPNLDSFAENEAISLSNAFCQNPVCVPSRCSFLSGFYPHAKGFRTMHHLMSSDDENILTELKRNGYHVYFGGKNDAFRIDVPLSHYCDDRSDAFDQMAKTLQGRTLREGYRSVGNMDPVQIADAEYAKNASRRDVDSPYYYAIYQGVIHSDNPFEVGYSGAEDMQIADAVDYILNYQSEKPLCMYLPLMLPHPWYACTEETWSQIDRTSIEPCIRLSNEQRAGKPSIENGMRLNHRLYRWDDDSLLDFKQTYYAMIAHIDSNFQKVIDAFKSRGIYNDTAVLVFSDHGDYAGEYELAEINQNTFEDFLTRVPLLIKPPNDTAIIPGVRDCLAELVDIPPTIAEMCGIELSYEQHGASLCHLFSDPSAHHKEYVFCEGGRLETEKHCTDGGHEPSMLYWARTSVQERMPEHTKAVMIRGKRFKYVRRLYEQDELYDLEFDPKETNNAINNPVYHDIIQLMEDKLVDFFLRTGDCVPVRRDAR